MNPTNHRDAYQQRRNLNYTSNFGAAIANAFKGAGDIADNIGERNLMKQARQYKDDASLQQAIQQGQFKPQGGITGLDVNETQNVLNQRTADIQAEEQRILNPLMQEANRMQSAGNFEGITALGSGQPAFIQEALNNKAQEAKVAIFNTQQTSENIDNTNFFNSAIEQSKQGVLGNTFGGEVDAYLSANYSTIQNLPPNLQQPFIDFVTTNFKTARSITGENKAVINNLVGNATSYTSDITNQYDTAIKSLADKYNMGQADQEILAMKDGEVSNRLDSYTGILGEDAEGNQVNLDVLQKLRKMYKTKTGAVADDRDMLSMLQNLPTESDLIFWDKLSNNDSDVTEAVLTAINNSKSIAANRANYAKEKGALTRERDGVINRTQAVVTDATKKGKAYSLEETKSGKKATTLDRSKYNFPSFGGTDSLLYKASGGGTAIDDAVNKEKVTSKANENKLKEIIKQSKDRIAELEAQIAGGVPKVKRVNSSMSAR